MGFAAITMLSESESILSGTRDKSGRGCGIKNLVAGASRGVAKTRDGTTTSSLGQDGRWTISCCHFAAEIPSDQTEVDSQICRCSTR